MPEAFIKKQKEIAASRTEEQPDVEDQDERQDSAQAEPKMEEDDPETVELRDEDGEEEDDDSSL